MTAPAAPAAPAVIGWAVERRLRSLDGSGEWAPRSGYLRKESAQREAYGPVGAKWRREGYEVRVVPQYDD